MSWTRVPRNGGGPEQRLVEHDADAVPVARLADPLAEPQLGGHVQRGADDRRVAPLATLGLLADQAEVEDDDPPGRGREDVRGLDVAVEHPGGVQRLHAEAHLGEAGAQALEVGQRRRGQQDGAGDHDGAGGRLADRRAVVAGEAAAGGPGEHVELGRVVLGVRAGQGEAVTQVAGQRDAVDQLHGEEPVAVVLEQLVQADEVRVAEVGEGPELFLEAVQLVGGVLVRALDRDRVAALAVEGGEHGPERAGAEGRLDLEATATDRLFKHHNRQDGSPRASGL
jgi:hypothetical protein